MTRTRTGHRRRRARRPAAAATLAVVTLAAGLLSGCSTERFGAAAVIDGRTVSTDELQDATQQHLEVVPGADTGDAQLAILQRVIVSAVIDEAARENGVRVSAGRVAAERDGILGSVGGRQALVRALAQAQQPTVLAPDDIDRWVKDRLLFEGIAETLGGADAAPNSAEEQQVIARANEALASASRSLDIEISPRYGRWDPDRGVTPLLSGGLSATVDELRRRGS